MVDGLRWRALAYEGRAILKLGGPLLVANLALAGMPLADTLMAGRLGAQSLAGIAVGSSLYALALYLGLGVMTALSPLTAHAYGAGDREKIGRYARQIAWVAGFLALVLFLLLLPAREILLCLGTDATVISTATGYVHSLSFGLPAILMAHALRCTSEGVGRTRPVMVVTLAGLGMNVLLNWVFMFGHLGAPAMGAVGTGVATALSQWVMAGLYLSWFTCSRGYRSYGIAVMPDRPDGAVLKEILMLGLPMGGTLLAETGLFSAAGLMVGTLGAETVAAHQIALNYASFTFMAPVSFHSATTIQVGHALGGRDRRAGRAAGFAGISLCVALMASSAIILFLFCGDIARLYSADSKVQSIAAHLLLLAGLFQISDGLQVGAMGALRGFKDARLPLAITLGAYWVVGFPVAYYAGLVSQQGPAGVWLGLIAGLTTAAILLLYRYEKVSR